MVQSIFSQYKDAIVNVLGIIGSISMLAYGFVTYRGLIEQMLAAIFYK